MKKLNKYINNILEIATFSVRKDSGEKKYDNVTYHIVGDEKTKKYFENIDKIWYTEKEIRDTVSKTKIENYLEKLLIKLHVEDRKCNDSDSKLFIDTFLNLPIEEIVVFNEIYGIQFQSENAISFGNFNIYNLAKHKNIIIEQFPNFEKVQNGRVVKGLKSNYLISYPVKSRDFIKAKEIALEKFKQFENTLNFFVANLTHINRIGISEFDSFNVKITIAVSKSSNTTSEESLNYNSPLQLDTLKLESKPSFNKLLDLIEKSSRTEMETRILNSVDWTSQGIIEKDNAKALIYFTFGIESLLQMDRENIVSPSILSYISDMLALIIGTSFHNKLRIVKKFKEVYGKRSAIAHSGSKNVNRADLYEPLFMIKTLIESFLINEDLTVIQNSKQLRDWFIEKKLN